MLNGFKNGYEYTSLNVHTHVIMSMNIKTGSKVKKEVVYNFMVFKTKNGIIKKY